MCVCACKCIYVSSNVDCSKIEDMADTAREVCVTRRNSKIKTKTKIKIKIEIMIDSQDHS